MSETAIPIYGIKKYLILQFNFTILIMSRTRFRSESPLYTSLNVK